MVSRQTFETPLGFIIERAGLGPLPFSYAGWQEATDFPAKAADYHEALDRFAGPVRLLDDRRDAAYLIEVPL
jgi:hypothetical protein